MNESGREQPNGEALLRLKLTLGGQNALVPRLDEDEPAARADGGLGALELLAEPLSRTLWLRDPDTATHCQRVASLAGRLCRGLGLPQDEQRRIVLGALLHDIGKVGVPDSILYKPDRLDGREWNEMRAHPVYGRRILESIPDSEPIWRLVYGHHERLDGHGYPEGLQEKELGLGLRIVTLVDAADAMLSRRPYRDALGIDQTISELFFNAGSQFDPDLVRVFVKMLDEESDSVRRDAV